ncbi:MAG: AMP-binding protein, partial [Actinobacteria bacterium]|nr:AMP-binding protein [Actinomycetota bacterium]
MLALSSAGGPGRRRAVRDQSQREGDEVSEVADGLERKLEGMLEIETFEPPAAFREKALWSDPAVYEEAAADPEAWWTAQARELLDWDVPPTRGLEDSDPPFYRWFSDGRLNASHNCLDRHVAAGLGDRVAYHWRGEEGERRDVTYAELLEATQRFANALKDLGVEKGDVVGIYLPMIPEVAVAMLACARIGAIHNVVFGGFSAESVRDRMEFSEAKALVTVDGARRKGRTAPVKEQVDEHLGDLGSLERIVVVRATGIECPMSEGRDVFYDEVCAAADPECPAEPMEAEHPLFILYTSGSTAKPKGILHTTGGYMTGVTTTHRYVFDLKPETDVWWCAADVGWITGHSYIVYGPLANGAT